MCKVSITPQAMTLSQAVHLFESLNPTGRHEFYALLTDDERDALYTQATDNLIARVHLTTKNRIDAQTNKARQKQRGYIVPDECHHAENECLWRSAAWRVLFGQVCESLKAHHHDDSGKVDAEVSDTSASTSSVLSPSYLQAHFDALVKEVSGKASHEETSS